MKSLVVCVSLLCVSVWGLPDGAPLQACSDLLPDHFVPPQFTPPPYRIDVERNGEGFRVTLVKTSDAQFRGFILQARNTFFGFITGRFQIVDASASQTLQCPFADDVDNTVTHTNNEPKDSITVDYFPPEGSDGSDITLEASVVQNVAEFWIGLEVRDLSTY